MCETKNTLFASFSVCVCVCVCVCVLYLPQISSKGSLLLSKSFQFGWEGEVPQMRAASPWE